MYFENFLKNQQNLPNSKFQSSGYSYYPQNNNQTAYQTNKQFVPQPRRSQTSAIPSYSFISPLQQQNLQAKAIISFNQNVQPQQNYCPTYQKPVNSNIMNIGSYQPQSKMSSIYQRESTTQSNYSKSQARQSEIVQPPSRLQDQSNNRSELQYEKKLPQSNYLSKKASQSQTTSDLFLSSLGITRQKVSPSQSAKRVQVSPTGYSYVLSHNFKSKSTFEQEQVKRPQDSKYQNKQIKDQKYFTPLVVKQTFNQNQSEPWTTNIDQRDSRVDYNNAKHNQKQRISEDIAVSYFKDQMRKPPIMTQRDLYKNTSSDALLRSTHGTQLKKQSFQQGNMQNKYSISTYPQAEVAPRESQQSLLSITSISPSTKPPPIKPYHHTLLQNLQKKLTEQKKSTESFQVKQNKYLLDITLKEQKIRQLTREAQKQKNQKNRITNQLDKIKQEFDKIKYESNKENQEKKRKNSIALKQTSTQYIILQRDFQNIKSKNQINQNNIQTLRQQIKQLNQYIRSLNQQIKQVKNDSQLKQIQLNTIKKSFLAISKEKEQINQQLFQQRVKSLNKIKQLKIQLEADKDQTINKLKQSFQQQKHNSLSKFNTLQSQLRRSVSDSSSLSTEINELKIQLQKGKSECQNYLSQLRAQQTHRKNLSSYISQMSRQLNLLQQKQSSPDQNLNQIQKLKNQNHRLRQTVQKLGEDIQKHLIQKDQVQAKIMSVQLFQDRRNQSIKQLQTGLHDKDTEIKKLKKNSHQIQKVLIKYHQKYYELSTMFNITYNKQNFKSQLKQKSKKQQQFQSLSLIEQQASKSTNPMPAPSLSWLTSSHPLLKTQIQKVVAQVKHLLSTLMIQQTEGSQKNQKIHQLSLNLKKQTNKLNAVANQIYLKNLLIQDLNTNILEAQVRRLNQKYMILRAEDIKV